MSNALPRFRAGAAEVEITPPLGVQVSGNICRHRPAQEVIDPIYARALVVESAGHRLCYVSLDVLAIGHQWTDEIRRQAAQRFGLNPSTLMLHATQNHSAPAIGNLVLRDETQWITPELWWARGGDDRYPPFVVPLILQAIERAIAQLRPVSIGAANGVDGRVGFNRRFLKRDGTVQINPTGIDLTDVLQVEGPADPHVGVVCFRDDEDHAVAALLHHTAHPVHYFTRNAISAGWPGAWADRVKETLGPKCVPLVVNGCCGNISTNNVLDADHRDDCQLLGERLMQTTRAALEQITYEQAGPVDYAGSHLSIPLAAVDPAELADAQALLNQHPQPIWENEAHTAVDPSWLFAVQTIDRGRRVEREPDYRYEIQVFRIGPAAIVGLTGEPFVEGQLRLKLESPFRHTRVAHMSNGYIGYIPTTEAYHRIGYFYRTPEGQPVRRGPNTYNLVPDALDRIVNETVKLLRQIN